jgi:plastocyanin
MTASPMPTVTFGTAGPGNAYSPACIKIKTGQSVTWNGNFAGHPLQGGSAGTPDPQSPIGLTNSGTMKTVTFSKSGTYPYYCTIHYSVGMVGTVFVQ